MPYMSDMSNYSGNVSRICPLCVIRSSAVADHELDQDQISHARHTLDVTRADELSQSVMVDSALYHQEPEFQ